MIDNLFTKNFYLIFLLIFFIEIWSFFSHQYQIINYIFFLFCFVILLYLAIKKPSILGLIALGELITGSHGRLFQLEILGFNLSIRILIFGFSLVALLITIVQNKNFNQWSILKKYFSWTPLALAIIIFWGILQGLIQGNNFSLIYSDVNGWVFWFYLLIWPFFYNSPQKIKHTLQVFFAGLLMICLKSLFLLFAFSHKFAHIKIIYRWARDTRFGEITLLSGNFYRIFSQAHIFILIGLIILLALIFFQDKINWRQKNTWGLFSLIVICLTTTLISLSRSNWVGLAFGGLFILIMSIFYYRYHWKRILLFIGIGSGALITAIALIAIIVFFPFPKPTPLDPSEMLKERLNMEESAIGSRWSQIPNLVRGLINHPILGSGWGTTITYQSQDPRILATNPDGFYQTYAFEWGYLDILLKIGLLGLFIYSLLIYQIIKNIVIISPDLISEHRAWIIGILAGLITLLATNIFSPYLNHPLGIGYLIFVIIFIIYFNQLTLKNYAGHPKNQS